MSNNFARPLNTNDLVFRFLTKTLEIDNDDAAEYTQDVTKAEILLEEMKCRPTLEFSDNRNPKYKQDEIRKILRSRIFDELRQLNRLEDDEKISLGNGGAKPNSAVRKENQAFLVIGLPASGKSSISSKVADYYGAYVVDSDYAKRKFPEYKHEFGASILHEESTLVTYGSSDNPKHNDEPCLIEYCLSSGINIVIPKIGHSMESLSKLFAIVKAFDYSVHLTLVSLDRQESCRRALDRYLNTKRYVPLGLIFDDYANDPVLTYYRLKSKKDWASTGKISTLNLREQGPTFIEGDYNNPACIFK
ncbi:zeta toxin family protein [Methylomonas sp. MO1]|uniref:zeta toxin family protein n=1 Tax=Methylomonas sp. MO1 TaxID=3073619 RepID=UPI0028A50DA8|nr:zeta toxin family protein [Methylomonas sp. MO1]MDT4289441.1 zeta toxin family protein [Methylomonas sp. MO1]